MSPLLDANRPSHIIKHKTGPDDPELFENLQDGLSQVLPEDLLEVADILYRRHQEFTLLFDKQNIPAFDENNLRLVCMAVATAKKNARSMFDVLIDQDIQKLLTDLVHGAELPGERVQRFVESVQMDNRLALEFSTGVLHYTDPSKYWLWTRWHWDIEKETGILALAAGSVKNLLADTIAEGYVKVGQITVMSEKLSEGTDLLSSELLNDPNYAQFTSDVFLAASYAVYLYGVTAWRLSREFNSLLPPLPQLMRKLLGIPKRKAPTPTG